jgi:hypothetical protein
MREHHIDHQYSRELIDEKLSIIGKDITGIVRRVGDSGGGLYIISELVGYKKSCQLAGNGLSAGGEFPMLFKKEI